MGEGADLPQLPAGFAFGASTASYQIEGAVAEDGRGPSIWDTFCAQPGRIKDGGSGTMACDHYHRYADDIALMKRLGLHGYRLSLAWPRIQPDGSGAVNQRGVDFYLRLLDELAAAGIEPMVTLFHWDLPQSLQDAGGWQQRETAQRFAEYAGLMGDRLGDRVARWAPINEPNVFTLLGHAVGVHAPGLELGVGVLPVAHHLSLGHGLAVQALRASGAKVVGSATNHHPIWAASDSAADREVAAAMDDLWNWNYVDPMLLGRYPDRFAAAMPVQDGDLATIRQPLDFYGVNYYNPMNVSASAAEGGVPFEQATLRQRLTRQSWWLQSPVLVG